MPFEGTQLDEREQVKEQTQLKKEIMIALYGQEAEKFQRDSAAEEKYWTDHHYEIADKIKSDEVLRTHVERYIAVARPSDNFRRRLEVTLQSLDKKAQAVGARMAFLGELKTNLPQNSPAQPEAASPPSSQEKDTTAAEIRDMFGSFSEALNTNDDSVRKFAEDLSKQPDWRNRFFDLVGENSFFFDKELTEKGVRLNFASIAKLSALLAKPELAPNDEMRKFLEAFNKSAQTLQKNLRELPQKFFPNGEKDYTAYIKDLMTTPRGQIFERFIQSPEFRAKLWLDMSSGGGVQSINFSELGHSKEEVGEFFESFAKDFKKYLDSLGQKPNFNPFKDMLDFAGLQDLENEFKKQYPDVKNVYGFGWPFLQGELLEESVERTELLQFAEDLVKQPDWQKKIVANEYDFDFYQKLDLLIKRRELKIPAELRNFLDEFDKLKTKLEQKTADYILTLFPKKLESVIAFIDEVKRMPQEKLVTTLQESAEFSYKFLIARDVAREAKNTGTLAKFPETLLTFDSDILLPADKKYIFYSSAENELAFIKADVDEWKSKVPQLKDATFLKLRNTYSHNVVYDFSSHVLGIYRKQQEKQDNPRGKFSFNKKEIQDVMMEEFSNIKKSSNIPEKEQKVMIVAIEKLNDAFENFSGLMDKHFPNGLSDIANFAKSIRSLPVDQFKKTFQEDAAFRYKVNVLCTIENKPASALKYEKNVFFLRDSNAFSKFFNGITAYVDQVIQPEKRDVASDVKKLLGVEQTVSEIQKLMAEADPAKVWKKEDVEAFDALAQLAIQFGVELDVSNMVDSFPADPKLQQILADADKLPTLPIQSSGKPGNLKNKPEPTRPGLITREMAANMSMGELMANLIKVIMEFSDKFGGFLGGDPAKMGEALKKLTGKQGFTKEELEKRNVDVTRDNEKNHGPDKSAEYVATVLGLGLSKNTANSEAFLNAFRTSGMVLEQDWGKKNTLQTGDVLFFGQENSEKKKVPYLTAVICETQPNLKMKMVPKEGGKPVIMTVEESEFFKRGELMGFLHFPPQTADTKQGVPPVSEKPKPSVS